MKMKRIISLAIALLLVCGMPVSAFADDWYLENGDITVNAGSNRFDGVSGATVSSKAVTKGVNTALAAVDESAS